MITRHGFPMMSCGVIASAEQRDAHRLQVPAGDDAPGYPLHLVVRGAGLSAAA